MTGTLSDALIGALREAGIPAYPEYPQRPFPPEPYFVTAACTETVCGMPLQSVFGDALPVTLTFRIRLHCRPDTELSVIAGKADACILRFLMQNQIDLREIRFGELQYVRQTGRLVRETLLKIRGTCCLTGEEDTA